MKNFILLSLLLSFSSIFIPRPIFASDTQAEIFYSQFCSGCKEYIEDELTPTFKKLNLTFEMKDYIQDKNAQNRLALRVEELDIPQNLIGHMMTFVDNKVFAGHVPISIIEDLLGSNQTGRFEKILVFQDLMHGTPTDYKVWTGGEIKTYPINEPISTFLNESINQTQTETKDVWLLPLVVGTALLDSLNPCAFAFLLFFIAFLYTIGRTRFSILGMGISYISAIYLAYFLIGLGLLGAIVIFGSPHFMAKVGAYLIIALGIINLQSFFFPKSPIKLAIPELSKETIKNFVAKATIPASFILGFLVGLCTFPCSGGPYVAILTLLSTKSTFWSALGYLLIYNFFFVFPLIMILLFASNKIVTQKVTTFEQKHARFAKFLSSMVMVSLGLLILLFFV
jgi:cytochrome c biogenesis protein CcdA